MNRKPLVSVVICNYNYGRFLDAAIRSVLEQTYKPVEVIVVDDGSTDGSAGVLQRQPPAVVRLHTPRRGQIGALWAGVQACHGDYVCLMDSDDVWHPEKVSQVAALFRTCPETGWVRHKLAVTDQDLRILGPAVPEFRGSGRVAPNPYLFLERTVTVSTSALAIRRAVAVDAFEQLRRLLPGPPASAMFGGLTHHADVSLLTVLGAGGIPGYSLDQVLGYYRRHSAQKFSGPGAAARLIEQQAEVGRLVSRIWSAKTGVPLVASHVFKHLLIVAALGGARTWGRERSRTFWKGVCAASALARRSPRLFARQIAALSFAMAAPHVWLARLLSRQGIRDGAAVL